MRSYISYTSHLDVVSGALLHMLEEQNTYLIPVSNQPIQTYLTLLALEFILNDGVNVVDSFPFRYIDFVIPYRDRHHLSHISETRFHNC